jgi:hypothetical protein
VTAARTYRAGFFVFFALDASHPGSLLLLLFLFPDHLLMDQFLVRLPGASNKTPEARL